MLLLRAASRVRCTLLRQRGQAQPLQDPTLETEALLWLDVGFSLGELAMRAPVVESGQGPPTNQNLWEQPQ